MSIYLPQLSERQKQSIDTFFFQEASLQPIQNGGANKSQNSFFGTPNQQLLAANQQHEMQISDFVEHLNKSPNKSQKESQHRNQLTEEAHIQHFQRRESVGLAQREALVQKRKFKANFPSMHNQSSPEESDREHKVMKTQQQQQKDKNHSYAIPFGVKIIEREMRKKKNELNRDKYFSRQSSLSIAKTERSMKNPYLQSSIPLNVYEQNIAVNSPILILPSVSRKKRSKAFENSMIRINKDPESTRISPLQTNSIMNQSMLFSPERERVKKIHRSYKKHSSKLALNNPEYVLIGGDGQQSLNTQLKRLKQKKKHLEQDTAILNDFFEAEKYFNRQSNVEATTDILEKSFRFSSDTPRPKKKFRNQGSESNLQNLTPDSKYLVPESSSSKRKRHVSLHTRSGNLQKIRQKLQRQKQIYSGKKTNNPQSEEINPEELWLISQKIEDIVARRESEQKQAAQNQQPASRSLNSANSNQQSSSLLLGGNATTVMPFQIELENRYTEDFCEFSDYDSEDEEEANSLLELQQQQKKNLALLHSYLQNYANNTLAKDEAADAAQLENVKLLQQAVSEELEKGQRLEQKKQFGVLAGDENIDFELGEREGNQKGTPSIAASQCLHRSMYFVPEHQIVEFSDNLNNFRCYYTGVSGGSGSQFDISILKRDQVLKDVKNYERFHFSCILPSVLSDSGEQPLSYIEARGSIRTASKKENDESVVFRLLNLGSLKGYQTEEAQAFAKELHVMELLRATKNVALRLAREPFMLEENRNSRVFGYTAENFLRFEHFKLCPLLQSRNKKKKTMTTITTTMNDKNTNNSVQDAEQDYLSPEEIVLLLYDVCSALCELHRAGAAHCALSLDSIVYSFEKRRFLLQNFSNLQWVGSKEQAEAVPEMLHDMGTSALPENLPTELHNTSNNGSQKISEEVSDTIVKQGIIFENKIGYVLNPNLSQHYPQQFRAQVEQDSIAASKTKTKAKKIYYTFDVQKLDLYVLGCVFLQIKTRKTNCTHLTAAEIEKLIENLDENSGVDKAIYMLLHAATEARYERFSSIKIMTDGVLEALQSVRNFKQAQQDSTLRNSVYAKAGRIGAQQRQVSQYSLQDHLFIGDLYYHTLHYKSCESVLQNAVEGDERAHTDSSEFLEALSQLWKSNYFLREYDLAINNFTKFSKKASGNSAYHIPAEDHFIAAYLYQRLEMDAEAVKQLEKVQIKLIQKHQHESAEMVHVYNNLASLLLRQQNNEGALHYYLLAAKIYRSLASKQQFDDTLTYASILNNLAHLYNESKNVSKTIGYLEESLRVKESISGSDDFSLLKPLQALAYLYFSTHDCINAQIYLNRSLQLRKKFDNIQTEPMHHLRLMAVQLRLRLQDRRGARALLPDLIYGFKEIRRTFPIDRRFASYKEISRLCVEAGDIRYACEVLKIGLQDLIQCEGVEGQRVIYLREKLKMLSQDARVQNMHRE